MNVVVLSRNPALYSTQSIVSAGRQRGHMVRVIDHMFCDLIISNDGMRVEYFGEDLGDVDVVIPRIGASATEYGAAVIRQFEAMGVLTTLPSESLIRSRDKLKCLQVLAAHNIPIPHSAISNDLESTDRLIDLMGGIPIVIKLLVSTQGLGVVLAKSRQTAASVLESFHRLNQKAMYQEFIGESKGEDIRVLVVDGEVVASMSRTAAEGDFRSNLHRGGTSRPIDLSRKDAELALKAARVLGMRVAGVDLLRSDRGTLILEVNASPGLEGIENTTGISISNKIYQYVERRKREEREASA
jgi:ribosomal protein S6--L-glutamate ligase